MQVEPRLLDARQQVCLWRMCMCALLREEFHWHGLVSHWCRGCEYLTRSGGSLPGTDRPGLVPDTHVLVRVHATHPSGMAYPVQESVCERGRPATTYAVRALLRHVWAHGFEGRAHADVAATWNAVSGADPMMVQPLKGGGSCISSSRLTLEQFGLLLGAFCPWMQRLDEVVRVKSQSGQRALFQPLGTDEDVRDMGALVYSRWAEHHRPAKKLDAQALQAYPMDMDPDASPLEM